MTQAVADAAHKLATAEAAAHKKSEIEDLFDTAFMQSPTIAQKLAAARAELAHAKAQQKNARQTLKKFKPTTTKKKTKTKLVKKPVVKKKPVVRVMKANSSKNKARAAPWDKNKKARKPIHEKPPPWVRGALKHNMKKKKPLKVSNKRQQATISLSTNKLELQPAGAAA